MPAYSLLVVGILLASPFWTASEPENPLRHIRHHKASVKYESGTHVSVSPSVIDQSSAMVEVAFGKATSPADDDWIGVWLLDDTTFIDPKKHAPVKYQYCSHDKSYMSKSSGKVTLQLINMRATYQMGFLTGGIKNPLLVAVSNLVTFTNPNQPLQGHLALTKNYNEMLLMWVTLDIGSPQAKWGTASGQYDFTKNATTSTYSSTDMCDSPAKDYGWIDPGKIHRVVLDNLKPVTKYYYTFGSVSGGWSEERIFMSAPVPGPEANVRVLAYGDMGHGEVDMSNEISWEEQASLNTTANLMNDTGDFIMHVGDISYAEGFGAGWDEFFHQLQPIMSSMPYMVNPGNHESDSINSNTYYQGNDSGGECSVPYVNRFAMPRLGPHQPWYDFMYGNLHVVMMSTEHDFRTSSTQYADLVEMLESVNRSQTPWLLFSGHRPMYISSTYGDERSSDLVVAELLLEHIEPLLLKYEVDLALWGHHHSYQTTCPVRMKKCEQGSPVHHVIGNAGQKLSKNIEPTKPPYFEYIDDQRYGYARMTTTAISLLFESVFNSESVHSVSIQRKHI